MDQIFLNFLYSDTMVGITHWPMTAKSSCPCSLFPVP